MLTHDDSSSSFQAIRPAVKHTEANNSLDFFEGKIDGTEAPKIKRLKLHHINDQSLGLSRDAYASARSEKDARAAFSSAIKRVLSQDVIVVADGMNYIKGFRYQLYCEAKAVQTPNCVVHAGTPAGKCRELNDSALATGNGGYTPETFENLVFRYEETQRYESLGCTAIHGSIRRCLATV